MNNKLCSSCGSNKVGIRTDKRGVAEYYCEDCGKGLGKASSADLVGIIDLLRADNAPKQRASKPEPKDERPPCKYCTERYVMLQGNIQTRVIQVPIEPVYCPMCGRKLSIHDRDY